MVKKVVELGTPKTPKNGKNCTSCALFASCHDPKKAYEYRCSKWIAFSDWMEKTSKEKKTTKKSKLIIPKQKKIITNLDDPEDIDNFGDYLRDLVKDESGMVRDLRVDDRDLKEAPNFLKWCVGKDYLNVEPHPYAKQLQIGLHLFSDFCPNPKCTNLEYVYDIPVEDTVSDIRAEVTLLKWGICPRCKLRRSEAIKEGTLNPYNELAGLAGQRGGKSYVTGRLLSTYVLHRYLKLQNPARYFGLADTVLHGTFIAHVFKQAKASLWDPFIQGIEGSPWFTEYHNLLKDRGEKLGEELLRWGEEFIQYRHRGLLMNPASPDRKNLRGFTRFMGGIDEIGHFDNEAGNNKVKENAAEVYEAMARSFRTLRSRGVRLIEQGLNNVPLPMFMNISSPFSQTDMIVTLEKRSRKSTQIYGFHWATWEMNPYEPRKNLKEEFNSDPVKAWRDYGAVPPMSGLAFVSKAKHFNGVVVKGMQNCARLSSIMYETESKKLMTSGKLDWVWTDSQVPKLMSIDAGASNNSFAITVSHVDPTTGFPIFDFMGEVMPFPDRPINFASLYQKVIKPLATKMNVVMVVADRWESRKFLQDLEYELGIAWEIYSVEYNDFLQWREALYGGEFMIPKPEMTKQELKEDGAENYPKNFATKPISHFVFQALTVQDISGKTVEKGNKFTDDIFRAAVLAFTYLTNPDTAMNFHGVIRKMGAGSRYGTAARAGAVNNTGSAANGRMVVVRGGGFAGGSGGFSGAAISRGRG